MSAGADVQVQRSSVEPGANCVPGVTSKINWFWDLHVEQIEGCADVDLEEEEVQLDPWRDIDSAGAAFESKGDANAGEGEAEQLD